MSAVHDNSYYHSRKKFPETQPVQKVCRPVRQQDLDAQRVSSHAPACLSVGAGSAARLQDRRSGYVGLDRLRAYLTLRASRPVAALGAASGIMSRRVLQVSQQAICGETLSA
jgi:hypothetical protein